MGMGGLGDDAMGEFEDTDDEGKSAAYFFFKSMCDVVLNVIFFLGRVNFCIIWDWLKLK